MAQFNFPGMSGLGSAMKSQQRSQLWGNILYNALGGIGEQFGKGLGAGASMQMQEAREQSLLARKQALDLAKTPNLSTEHLGLLDESMKSGTPLTPQQIAGIQKQSTSFESDKQRALDYASSLTDPQELQKAIVAAHSSPTEFLAGLTAEQQYGSALRQREAAGREEQEAAELRRRGELAKVSLTEAQTGKIGTEAELEREKLGLEKEKFEYSKKAKDAETKMYLANAAKARREGAALSPRDPLKEYWKHEELLQGANAEVAKIEKQTAEHGFSTPEAAESARVAAQKSADRAQVSLDAFLRKNPDVLRTPEMSPPPELTAEQSDERAALRRESVVKSWEIRGKSRVDAERLADKYLGVPVSPEDEQRLAERAMAIQVTEGLARGVPVPIEEAVQMAREEMERERREAFGLGKPKMPPGGKQF